MGDEILNKNHPKVKIALQTNITPRLTFLMPVYRSKTNGPHLCASSSRLFFKLA